ncbi:hypothetical protein AAVH_16864 [Aphelenchoides avenae]|nr:hypothetical protein AAVH_16864 [Aphelenchus avenae]
MLRHISICVDRLRLEMGDVNANFVQGIIDSMRTVRRLEISYAGDAGSIDVDFLLSCSTRGITDLSIDSDSRCGKKSSWLHAEDIVDFVLAGATDGQHRKIEFAHCVVDADGLLKLLLEFTFELRGLRAVDLRRFDQFLHGDVLVVDDSQNGMIMEMKIKKEYDRYVNGKCDISTDVVIRPLSVQSPF